MRPIARLGDRTKGVCKGHKDPIVIGGTIVSSSDDTIANGSGIARIGDTVKADCGHTGTIISGKPDDIANGRSKARIGDSFTGVYSGNIISGSPNVF